MVTRKANDPVLMEFTLFDDALSVAHLKLVATEQP
jgi:hypothetical protein